MDARPSLAERAAFIRYLKDGKRRRASGFRLGGTLVLTAAHCASGEGITVQAASEGSAASATVYFSNDLMGLAILDCPSLPAVLPVQVGMIQRRWLGAISVLAIGFPKWRDVNGEPHTAQVAGIIPLGEGRPASISTRASVTMRVSDGLPPQAGDMSPGSVWRGMSGSAVLSHEGILVGVIRSHAPAHGPATILVDTFERISSLQHDERELLERALDIRERPDWRRVRPTRPLFSTATPRSTVFIVLGAVLFLAGVFATALSMWAGFWWAPIAPAVLVATTLIASPAREGVLSEAGWGLGWGRLVALLMLAAYLGIGGTQAFSQSGLATVLSVASLWASVSILWWRVWPADLPFSATWLTTSTLLTGLIAVGSGWYILSQPEEEHSSEAYAFALVARLYGWSLLVFGWLMASASAVVLAPSRAVSVLVSSPVVAAFIGLGGSMTIAASSSRYLDSFAVGLAATGSTLVGIGVWVVLSAITLARRGHAHALARPTLILLMLLYLVFTVGDDPAAEGYWIRFGARTAPLLFGVWGLTGNWLGQGVASLVLSAYAGWYMWSLQSNIQGFPIHILALTTLCVSLAGYGLSRLGVLGHVSRLARSAVYSLNRAGLDNV